MMITAGETPDWDKYFCVNRQGEIVRGVKAFNPDTGEIICYEYPNWVFILAKPVVDLYTVFMFVLNLVWNIDVVDDEPQTRHYFTRNVSVTTTKPADSDRPFKNVLRTIT